MSEGSPGNNFLDISLLSAPSAGNDTISLGLLTPGENGGINIINLDTNGLLPDNNLLSLGISVSDSGAVTAPDGLNLDLGALPIIEQIISPVIDLPQINVSLPLVDGLLGGGNTTPSILAPLEQTVNTVATQGLDDITALLNTTTSLATNPVDTASSLLDGALSNIESVVAATAPLVPILPAPSVVAPIIHSLGGLFGRH